MKNKKLIALFLAVTLLCCSAANTLAAEIYINADTDLADVRAIALNTPQRFIPTSDWVNTEIKKITPMYNLEDAVVAYCVDLQNSETKDNAYVVVNADKTGYPIFQYAPQAQSPYYDENSGKALFLTAGVSYVEDNGIITRLGTDDAISKQDLLDANEAFTIEYVDEIRLDTADYSELRNNFIRGNYNARAGDTKEKILARVPTWQWHRGCSPTAVAMQIANLLPSVPSSGTTMIETLARYMGTASNGNTLLKNVPSGAQSYVYDCGFATQTIAVWQSENLFGEPRYGSTYNPYSAYTSEIDLLRAVSIQSANATVSTPGFVNGWTSHMITGVGYSYSTVYQQDKYVIVHTTEVSGGNVYIPINGTALGSYAWFKIVQ